MKQNENYEIKIRLKFLYYNTKIKNVYKILVLDVHICVFVFM